MLDDPSPENAHPPHDTDAPFRAEILASGRLEESARVEARGQRSTTAVSRRPTPLGALLRDAGADLSRINRFLVECSRTGRATSAATEWLLDNYYLVDEQVRTADDGLPPGFGARLPRLTASRFVGFPRVWRAAVVLLSHTDSRLDAPDVDRFIEAYQDVSPLTISETWSVPGMLRIGLVENLRRLALRVEMGLRAELDAETWANRLLAAADADAQALPATVARLDEAFARLEAPTTFLLRLSQRLGAQEREIGPALRWMEGAFSRLGAPRQELVSEERQRAAADQVSIANAITSIRFIGSRDWRAFFESVNRVERLLRTDPAGVYPDMDFASRDRYRHAVQALGKHCAETELQIAGEVIARAADALRLDAGDLAAGHVGYYLVGDACDTFARQLGCPEPGQSGRARWYSLMLVASTAVLVAVLAAYAYVHGAAGWAVALLSVLALVPVSGLAEDLVGRSSAALWKPRLLAKMDFERPLAEGSRALVVVPTLLTSDAAVGDVLSRIEIHLLANRDPNIHFALLGDLKTAGDRQLVADAAIIDRARDGIAALNARYAAEGSGPFHLFVRDRSYNKAEAMWMGWERKRGALTELTRYLRGAADTTLSTVEGDSAFLPSVTFVVTLDADTVLPRDAARKLVCTISHPLNRARIDAQRRIVTRGYGLVQPRVGMTLESATATPFAALNTGPAGIDPYSGAVSDTYMDVFGEGSFTGKGVFEVDVFNTVLEGRFPDETLLSHDLMEGNFLRTGLASDIEVLDEFPPDYGTQCSRLHRWTRGDWQTTPWLWRNAPAADGGTAPNPLRPLHKWKILENLRRSLLPASIIVLGAAGWLLIPRARTLWAAALALLIVYPALMHAFDTLTGGWSAGLRGVTRSVVGDLGTDLVRALVTLAFLPHQALLLLDATLRALWRMRISHRRLLQWTTAAEARATAESALGDYGRLMGPAALIGFAGAAATAFLAPASLYVMAFGAALWLLSPVYAWRLSQPYRRREDAALTAEETAVLRSTARRTWRFFETFMSDADHWLPPDNFQEDPKGEIAHRTSPTNMGLALLANLTARDLGYVGVGRLVDRCSRTLETMAGLARFRGHFYNWYDTVTLAPLKPAYVSTVDSGNLGGHLLALCAGLGEVATLPLVGPAALDGLADTLRLTLSDLRSGEGGPIASAEELRHGDELLRRVELARPPASIAGWAALLSGLGRGPERAPQLDDLASLAPWAATAGSVPHSLDDHPRLADLQPLVGGVPSLTDLAEGLADALEALDEIAASGPSDGARWAGGLAAGVREARPRCADLLAQLRLLQSIATEMWQHTDFHLLYDKGRELFSIGFNTEQGRCDDSYYDMLASECRLASYLAVARGDVPEEHWFRLGRQLTRVGGGFALVSWSASMFEYLMPLLVMRDYPDTLLDRTYRAVVRRQIEYGAERHVPWGVSESAFNAKDSESTYQYQAFGVPGLGLKRGLSEDVVIAPYATMLAVQVDRAASVANLQRLAREGGLGRYGFYEAIDYTPGRFPAGERRAIVKTYMAHHQGMALVALGNELTGHAMRRRFHSDPLVASAELLLQERVPHVVKTAQPHVEEVDFVRALRQMPPPVTRSYASPDTITPATHFLSNGRYSVMITNAGGGYSRWRDLAISRYREDVTRDCWGQFVFVRDTASGRLWSVAHQPVCAPADDYHCILSPDRAEFRRTDGEIETYTEIAVSPEDDVEVRRIALTNHGTAAFTLEVTSYFEIALTGQGGDQAHRAFSNLFVETERVPERASVLFTRRPRSAEEPRRWGVHALACDLSAPCDVTVETDRAAFVGRLRQAGVATAAIAGGNLSGTTGAVLDPVCSIRREVTIGPGETVRVAFTTGVAETREGALAISERYCDIRAAQRAIDLAWGTSEVELRDLGIAPDEAVVFQRLASRLLLTDAYSHLKVKTRRENLLPISGLWGLGISGDNPILLVRIERLEDTAFVRQALLAHQYWRHKGFTSDLVILNTRPSAYISELDQRLRLLVRTGQALELLDKPGGVFLRQSDQMAPEVLNLLQSVARATLDADAGPIVLQLNRHGTHPEPPDPFVRKRTEERPSAAPPFKRPHLDFDNGYGGIDPKTGEYVIVLEHGETTPAPWVNVMAMPEFGTMVTEAGVGCTWAKNSHENRLTTWNNDPVSDGSGEIIYVRDEETGEVWSPTPLPVQDDAAYVVRHGRGYTKFEHDCHGLRHHLTWFVPVDDPVRVATLSVKNLGNEPRRLSATQFVEWVLGDSRSRANQHVVTAYDTEGRMLVAHSHFNVDFPGRIAFLACDKRLHSFTADRTEFLGRNGSPAAPAAFGRVGLGGRTGRFHDNCGAVMTQMEVPAGGEVEVTFLLGQTDTIEEARALVARYRDTTVGARELVRVRKHWDTLLDTLKVSTPDPAFDAMVNGRALYQALACRVWGRTALYQSSGAFGFRDQLQDVMALTLARPDIIRAQIVEASRHQFEEGDVLHWWQPQSGRGVRTRFVDDRLWLPFVVTDYIETTGDTSVLREETPFISGPPLAEGHEDSYLVPQTSLTQASVYEHCVSAIEATRGTGAHGLPLMGGGDWNDGMNRVGIGGMGESVWMGWFLDLTLRRFAPVCEAMGEPERATGYREWADRLVAAVEESAWDGSWYRRAYFDDGTPLGTRDADECRIDAIAQAWSVIGGRADPKRAARALESVEEKLVRWDDGLIALLAPAFDQMSHDPGYIKGYVPGVRENGGQYTHAALWVVMAYAMAGDGDTAASLLDLINPLTRSRDRHSADVYRVEPYSIAADVYAVAPHVGRGGWTWYTGSAAWFHDVATRSILGIRTVADADGARYLVVDPTVPKRWTAFSAELRLGKGRWRISVENPRGVNRGVARTTLDGRVLKDGRVPLTGSGEHEVVVTMLGG